MSMHKMPLTELEESGLKAHGLGIGKPSQLSDAFLLGMRWQARHPAPAVPEGYALDADELSNFIRKIDGNHTMGAGALAENICEWLAAQQQEKSNEA